MRSVIAVLALLLATSASAQSTDAPITTWPTEWRGFVVAYDAAAVRGCVAGWSRPADPYARWVRNAAFINGAELAEQTVTAAAAAIATQDLTALASLRTRAVTAGDIGMCTAQLIPRPIAWSVAKNKTATTRPSYAFADGVRAAVSTSRATVGAECNCTVRSVEGRSTYCAFDAAQATVALCSRGD